MKKVILSFIFLGLAFTSYSQYRWEVSAGPSFSELKLDGVETEKGTGFFLNAGYGHVMGVRAKTSIVMSLDLLQRTSEILAPGGQIRRELKMLQVGATPKFRYLFGRGKDRFRAFINVGPSFRVNANVELDGMEVDSENFENVIIGGVYGIGFSQMIGEMFDVMMEIGAMNDFVDNFNDEFDILGDGTTTVGEGSSTFFDIYARIGIRFRIYDATR